jgi:hypothetical protein
MKFFPAPEKNNSSLWQSLAFILLSLSISVAFSSSCFRILFFLASRVERRRMVQKMHGRSGVENSLEGKRQLMHRHPLFIGRQIGTPGPTCLRGPSIVGAPPCSGAAVRSTPPIHARMLDGSKREITSAIGFFSAGFVTDKPDNSFLINQNGKSFVLPYV